MKNICYTLLLFVLVFSTFVSSQNTNSNKFLEHLKPVLTLESLLNCEYPYGEKNTIKLENGSCTIVYSEYYVFDAWQHKHISCELNGDSLIDAIVVLDTREGGSGRWQYIYPVINNNGIPNPLIPFELGDRENVQNIYKKDGKIFLEVLVHDINDPMCCPSINETWELVFKENEFKQIN